MALFPERLFGRKKETVTFRPEAPKISENLARETGVEKVETAFTANIKDDKGQPLIQTPQTEPLTIKIQAASTEELKEAKKGSIEETRPWNARFWIRAIKRAIHFGKQVIFGSPEINQPV